VRALPLGANLGEAASFLIYNHLFVQGGLTNALKGHGFSRAALDT